MNTSNKLYRRTNLGLLWHCSLQSYSYHKPIHFLKVKNGNKYSWKFLHQLLPAMNHPSINTAKMQFIKSNKQRDEASLFFLFWKFYLLLIWEFKIILIISYLRIWIAFVRALCKNVKTPNRPITEKESFWPFLNSDPKNFKHLYQSAILEYSFEWCTFADTKCL